MASLSTAVTDTSDGVIIVWCSQVAGVNQVRAQRLDTDGAHLWGPAGLGLCAAPYEQYSPTVCADGHGGILVAWEDYRTGGEADIWAQRVSSSGGLAWGNDGTAVCQLAGHQFSPAIGSDSDGGAIVTWVDGPLSARASYMRLRPASGGLVPRLESAVAAPGRAELAWRTEAGDARMLTVLRNDGTGNWQAIAVRRPDERGLLLQKDHGLMPGSVVAYRLASLEPHAETYYAEVSLEIPNPSALALRSVRAVAGGRVLKLAFTLQTDEPAAFEAFDVQGRRVDERALDTQGAGDYSLDVPLAHRLEGGLYFVRLRQGRTMKTLRLVVIK